jgi:hypothetical protein
MKSKAGQTALDEIHAMWFDHVSLLGGALTPTWGCGEMTQRELHTHVQGIMDKLARACGQGSTGKMRAGCVKFVTGRARSYRDGPWARINLEHTWRDIIYGYTWQWTGGRTGSKQYEMQWMRMYKKASVAFLTRSLYLPPAKAEPVPAPSKDDERRGKIQRLVDRRAAWVKKQERAEMWIKKIDRSLKAYRRAYEREQSKDVA